jgi:hypothetical protein
MEKYLLKIFATTNKWQLDTLITPSSVKKRQVEVTLINIFSGFKLTQ